ncbi:MAG TPA: response regulator [Nitrospiria bacterium]
MALDPVTILIADDEPNIVRSLGFILQKEGLAFDVAADGETALAKARLLRPKLLFLDIMMPKLSGFEVCSQIRSDAALDTIHIIMLTAKGQDEDRTKSLSAGADEYLSKPFSPMQVLERVKTILGT